jgi:hypothetical protein
MQPRQLVRLFLVSLVALFALAFAPQAAVFAGQPVDTSTLNPVPPSFLTCKAVGNDTICQGDRTVSYDLIDTADEGGAIVCGSGARAFDVFDQGAFDQHAIRYYDSNGNLVRRVIHENFTFGQYSNPQAGTTVPYTERNNITDVLAVPGNFDSATETITGEFIFRPAHSAPVFLNAGRAVFGPNGSVEFAAGPDGNLDYFFAGDASAIQKLCAALA